MQLKWKVSHLNEPNNVKAICFAIQKAIVYKEDEKFDEMKICFNWILVRNKKR